MESGAMDIDMDIDLGPIDEGGALQPVRHDREWWLRNYRA